tara:strand:- start:2901 stop:3089 length:189 start_codon:yes stop_codon:yes gene_type:complete
MARNYTLAEAAEKLRIPAGTLRKYRPEIGGAKLGRLWVFTEDELNRWMESRRHKPMSELQSA